MSSIKNLSTLDSGFVTKLEPAAAERLVTIALVTDAIRNEGGEKEKAAKPKAESPWVVPKVGERVTSISTCETMKVTTLSTWYPPNGDSNLVEYSVCGDKGCWRLSDTKPAE